MMAWQVSITGGPGAANAWALPMGGTAKSAGVSGGRASGAQLSLEV